MNGTPRTLPVLAGILALCALVFGWLAWSRVRSSRVAEPLLRYAPSNAQIYAFLDFELLRRTGVLRRLAGPGGVEEPDYRRFVDQTGFDYRRDLDAVVVAKRGTAVFAVVTGRFDDVRLRKYASSNGGNCADAYCYVPGAPPVSFVQIRPGIYGLGGGAADARELLKPHASTMAGEFLGSAIWATGLSPTEIPLLQTLPGVERLSLWVTPRLPANVDVRFVLETVTKESAAAAARDLGALSLAASGAWKEVKVTPEGKRVNGRVPLSLDWLESISEGTKLR